MNSPADAIRKTVSVAISLLMFTVSVAVPLMDRGELVVELAVESQHDPSRCQHAHDHTVCTQVGANVSVAFGTYRHRLAHVVVPAATPVDRQSTVTKTFLEGPPSRAPPLA